MLPLPTLKIRDKNETTKRKNQSQPDQPKENSSSHNSSQIPIPIPLPFAIVLPILIVPSRCRRSSALSDRTGPRLRIFLRSESSCTTRTYVPSGNFHPHPVPLSVSLEDSPSEHYIISRLTLARAADQLFALHPDLCEPGWCCDRAFLVFVQNSDGRLSLTGWCRQS